MPRNFNYIYSKLVTSDDDFIGKIAYSLYKEDKIEYITRIKREKYKIEVSEEDLEEFHLISSSDRSIERYKTSAQTLLQHFLNNTLSEAIEDATREIKSNHIQLLSEVVTEIKPPKFWMSVLHNLTASFALAAVIALFIVILNFTTDGIWPTLGKLFNLDIKNKSEQQLKNNTSSYLFQADTAKNCFN